jgi:hypothetical protein
VFSVIGSTDDFLSTNVNVFSFLPDCPFIARKSLIVNSFDRLFLEVSEDLADFEKNVMWEVHLESFNLMLQMVQFHIMRLSVPLFPRAVTIAIFGHSQVPLSILDSILRSFCSVIVLGGVTAL